MEKVPILNGEELKFSGYPVEIFYNEDDEDYYIKCKKVYLKYKKFLLWKKEPTKDKVAYNEEGTSCKITKIHSSVRIGCLTTDETSFNQLVNKILKTIKWHRQKQ